MLFFRIFYECEERALADSLATLRQRIIASIEGQASDHLRKNRIAVQIDQFYESILATSEAMKASV